MRNSLDLDKDMDAVEEMPADAHVEYLLGLRNETARLAEFNIYAAQVFPMVANTAVEAPRRSKIMDLVNGEMYSLTLVQREDVRLMHSVEFTTAEYLYYLEDVRDWHAAMVAGYGADILGEVKELLKELEAKGLKLVKEVEVKEVDANKLEVKELVKDLEAMELEARKDKV